jgi:hypothetical protein
MKAHRVALLVLCMFAIALLPDASRPLLVVPYHPPPLAPLAPPRALPPPRGGPFGLPLWPTAYCLPDANGVALIYHFFVLSLGALAYADPFSGGAIWRPGHTVRLFLPWLSPAGNVDKGDGLWAPVSAMHNETVALMAPDFEVVRGDADGGGCVALPQASLVPGTPDHVQRRHHVFLAAFFRAAVVRAHGPLPPFDPALLVYVTRVTRVGPRRREILNEAELTPLLAAQGFRVVALERLSVAEKVALFASARMVVSPQSAGLTFSMFMDRRAMVVEVYPNNGQWLHYKHMTDDLAIPFHRYSDTVTTDGGSPMLLNMRVNATHLAEAVRGLVAQSEARARWAEEPPAPGPASGD